jgi:hypothetical protein
MTSRIPAFVLLAAVLLLACAPRAEAVIKPALGRFLQSDPNATGLPLIENPDWFHAEGRQLSLGWFDLEMQHQDGANLYQYLRSNPATASDPLGLFAFLLPGPSDFIGGALASMIQEYSDRLEWDLDWAAEWDAEDDWHSRLDNKWVTVALTRGLYNAFEIGYGDYKANPLDMFASASGGTSPAPRGLPPATIVNQGGVRVTHYYHSGDHGPVHVNVQSDGQRRTRVGPFGKPIQSGRDRALTPKEAAVFKQKRFEINRAIKQIQRWLRLQPGNPVRERAVPPPRTPGRRG